MLINFKVIPAICSNESILLNDVGLSIKGRVTALSIPIPCRVRLFERLSGRMLFDVLTDNDGNYKFNHLTLNKFFIVAHHPLNSYNAVIQDNVVPK